MCRSTASRSFEEGIDLSLRSQSDEMQMRVPWVGRGVDVALDDIGVPAPRRSEDVALGVEAVEVAQRFTIAVPQPLTSDHPSYRADNDTTHHRVPGEVEPNNGVRSTPDEILDGCVVPIDDPSIAVEVFADPRTEGLASEIDPARLMKDRIQLDELHAETCRELPTDGRLA